MKKKPTPKAPASKPKTLTVYIAGGFVSRTFFRALQEKAEYEKAEPISEFQALGYLTALFEAGEIECINPGQPDSPPKYTMAKAVTIVL